MVNDGFLSELERLVRWRQMEIDLAGFVPAELLEPERMAAIMRHVGALVDLVNGCQRCTQTTTGGQVDESDGADQVDQADGAGGAAQAVAMRVEASAPVVQVVRQALPSGTDDPLYERVWELQRAGMNRNRIKEVLHIGHGRVMAILGTKNQAHQAHDAHPVVRIGTGEYWCMDCGNDMLNEVDQKCSRCGADRSRARPAAEVLKPGERVLAA